MNYNNDDIKELICYDGTKFIKGPFEADDERYDYKMKDGEDEDYCNTDQMESWFLEVKKVIWHDSVV